MMPRAKPNMGEVHIWWITLDTEHVELARLESFLSPEELIRASRLLDRQTRDRFIAGRGFLRETLAQYLERQPGSLAILAGDHGKPRLASPEEQLLRFNLSHASDHAVLVIASGCEVGVDIELVRKDLPFREMAQRYFSPREREELLSTPQQLQRAAFYRCWTRKEAYMKAVGTGFTLRSDSFDVSLLPDTPLALVTGHASAGPPAHWTIMDMEAPTGYCAALAIEGTMPVFHVQCLRNAG